MSENESATPAENGSGSAATTAADPALLKKVKEQIEFYFSDSNYPTDKFMREEAAKDRENYISLDVMLRFKKLKALTTDKSVIATAIADSDCTWPSGRRRCWPHNTALLPHITNTMHCTSFCC